MEKIKEIIKLLKEIEKEKGDIVVFKTYYHDIYLSDITNELENVLVEENEPEYWGY